MTLVHPTVYILCHRFVLSLQAAKATESSTPTIGRHQQTSGRYQQQAETDERLGEQKQCRMAGRKQETEGGDQGNRSLIFFSKKFVNSHNKLYLCSVFVESLNLFIPNWRKIWKDL